MIAEIKLPEISENVDSGEVIDVFVKEGDFIENEQSIAELETEKAAFDVPSTAKGKVIEVDIKKGDTVKVGQVLAKVDTEAKGEEKKAEQKVETPPAIKKAEKKPEKAPPAGKVEEKPPRKEPEKTTQVETGEEAPVKPSEAVSASPAVRQLARELGIDISEIKGTAAGGLITVDDVKNHVRSVISGTAGQAVPTVKNKPLPDFSAWGDIERKAISVTRKKIADTLSYTWSNVPQVTQYDRADITALEELRKEYSVRVELAGGKLTITSILLKAAALALKEFPIFNASFDADTQEIIYKKYVNIAIAVATDRGLLVPVVRDVDKKNILQLSVELTELAERTRQHKVTPDEMVGGNFTITNLGGIGGTDFAPIIYWPQAAILGVARAAYQPVYIKDRLEQRLILPLSLSYDHRIIDGAEGAKFIRWIAEYLEKPFLLALGENT